MKKVILTGHLGKRFGREIELDVASAAEAIRALCYMVPGFEEAMKQGSYRVVRMSDKVNDLGLEDLHLGLGRASGIKIVPVVEGRKKGGGLGKILLGALIIGATFFTMGAAGVGMSALAIPIGAGGITFGYLGSVGAMMVMSGVSAMLTPQPKAQKPAEQEDSFLIDATGNMTEQGSPVPIVFGECFTGSVLISTGMSTEEMIIVVAEQNVVVTEPRKVWEPGEKPD